MCACRACVIRTCMHACAHAHARIHCACGRARGRACTSCTVSCSTDSFVTCHAKTSLSSVALNRRCCPHTHQLPSHHDQITPKMMRAARTPLPCVYMYMLGWCAWVQACMPASTASTNPTRARACVHVRVLVCAARSCLCAHVCV